MLGEVVGSITTFGSFKGSSESSSDGAIDTSGSSPASLINWLVKLVNSYAHSDVLIRLESVEGVGLLLYNFGSGH